MNEHKPINPKADYVQDMKDGLPPVPQGDATPIKVGRYVRAACRGQHNPATDKWEIVDCDDRDAEMHAIYRLHRVGRDNVVRERIATVMASTQADAIVDELNELSRQVRASLALEA